MTKTTSAGVPTFGGASRESSTAARRILDGILKELSKDQAVTLANELFEVVSVLDSSTPLRRALTDGSREVAAKTKLVQEVFGTAVSGPTLKVLSELSALRWSSPSNLSDVLEQISIETEAAAANLAGELEQLEQELFDFSRIVKSDGELRQALSASKFSAESKRVLIAKIFGGKVSASTARVIAHLVSGLRGRNIERTISFYATAIAARRERVIAHVEVAISLTEAQKDKLAKTLSQKIGQPVSLNVEINPEVLGGFSIRFEDELIDASIVSRLADAGRALAV